MRSALYDQLPSHSLDDSGDSLQLFFYNSAEKVVGRYGALRYSGRKNLRPPQSRSRSPAPLGQPSKGAVRMRITVTIPDEAAAQVRAHGLTLESYVEKLIEDAPHMEPIALRAPSPRRDIGGSSVQP